MNNISDTSTSSDSINPSLKVLWGKSNADGKMNLLTQHLLDTAAVAELIWDHFLSCSVKNDLNKISNEHGKELLVLLCSMHDIGKATPAFQSKDSHLANDVAQNGLYIETLTWQQKQWHHSKASALMLSQFNINTERTLSGRKIGDWALLLIAGHHGKIGNYSEFLPNKGYGGGPTKSVLKMAHGLDVTEWKSAQFALIKFISEQIRTNSDLIAIIEDGSTQGIKWLPKVTIPSKSLQLSIAGAIIMADWIASNENIFTGVDDINDVSMHNSRIRAEEAWKSLGLTGGWDTSSLKDFDKPIKQFFNIDARCFQNIVIELSSSCSQGGLLVLEAPMGEGKTEAALAAAYILAKNTGKNGIFIGMPTQATSDPMYSRVREWAEKFSPNTAINLLHGKRMFNKDWVSLEKSNHYSGIDEDEYGCYDQYSSASSPVNSENSYPGEWFLGPKRGLLTPIVVGTIDQLLLAATKSKHVMLRQLGLLNKIVIIDEVHAYDAYMSQFLFEILRWLGNARVPVVLLSATLTKHFKAKLANAYIQGLTQDVEDHVTESSFPDRYPLASLVKLIATSNDENINNELLETTSVNLDKNNLKIEPFELVTKTSQTWRHTVNIKIKLCDNDDTGKETILKSITEMLEPGGTVLIIRNTIDRAQDLYGFLKSSFQEHPIDGIGLELLHGRFTTGDRAAKTEQVLQMMGKERKSKENTSMSIVVATQIAEQALDIDADILITDIAPIDLLLQRIGRLHRHERDFRPEKLRTPICIITGVNATESSLPTFDKGSEYIYGKYLLISTFDIIKRTLCDGWNIPDDIPSLIETCYDTDQFVESKWNEDYGHAKAAHMSKLEDREKRASNYLLSGTHHLTTEDLENLHYLDHVTSDEEGTSMIVRDSNDSIEVVLAVKKDNCYFTLSGHQLGENCEGISNESILQEVIESVVPLNLNEPLSSKLQNSLVKIIHWGDHPWLKRLSILPLDQNLEFIKGNVELKYDREIGLITRRKK